MTGAMFCLLTSQDSIYGLHMDEKDCWGGVKRDTLLLIFLQRFLLEEIWLWFGGVWTKLHYGVGSCRQRLHNNVHNSIKMTLVSHVIPFAKNNGNKLIVMHDNPRLDVARQAQNYLQEEKIDVIEWPPRSPEMNLTEQVWNMLRRRARTRDSRNLAELKIILAEKWNNIPEEDLRKKWSGIRAETPTNLSNLIVLSFIQLSIQVVLTL